MGPATRRDADLGPRPFRASGLLLSFPRRALFLSLRPRASFFRLCDRAVTAVVRGRRLAQSRPFAGEIRAYARPPGSLRAANPLSGLRLPGTEPRNPRLFLLSLPGPAVRARSLLLFHPLTSPFARFVPLVGFLLAPAAHIISFLGFFHGRYAPAPLALPPSLSL